jgi:zinc protease
MAFLRCAMSPSEWTFVFTGNINLETIRPLIAGYIASIPQRDGLADSWDSLKVKRPGPGSHGLTKGKENKATVYMSYFTPNAGFTERQALAAYVLSDYLDMQLNDVVREKLGGAYSTSADVGASLLPPGGEVSASVYFVCDPLRVDELIDAAHTQLKAVADGLVDAAVFEKAVSANIKSWERDMQSNGYQAGLLANWAALYDWPLAGLNARPANLRAVTHADITAMASALLSGGPVTLVMLPEREDK